MDRLTNDLNAINSLLAGATVLARGNRYTFRKLELDAERDPPVADGYVIHLRLRVCCTRDETVRDAAGNETAVAARYSLKPEDVEAFTVPADSPGLRSANKPDAPQLPE